VQLCVESAEVEDQDTLETTMESDPYIKIYHNSDLIHTTATVLNDLSPDWGDPGECVTFQAASSGDTFHFHAWDSDNGGEEFHDDLGQTTPVAISPDMTQGSRTDSLDVGPSHTVTYSVTMTPPPPAFCKRPHVSNPIYHAAAPKPRWNLRHACPG